MIVHDHIIVSVSLLTKICNFSPFGLKYRYRRTRANIILEHSRMIPSRKSVGRLKWNYIIQEWLVWQQN